MLGQPDSLVWFLHNKEALQTKESGWPNILHDSIPLYYGGIKLRNQANPTFYMIQYLFIMEESN
jgi:hypothetical protein